MKTMDEMIRKIENFEVDQTFVTDAETGKEYTYRDIYQRAGSIGSWLRTEGVSEIVVCMENSVELLIVYFAALLYQIVIIPVDPAKSEDEKNAIKNIHSQAIYAEGDFFAQSVASDRDCGECSFSKVDFDKLFLITYTSGSTGRPKGVMHSGKNLFLSAASFGEAMHYGGHTVFAHVMPMTYMAGILNSIFLPFVMGGRIVVLPRFEMKSAFGFWKTVVRYRINTFWLSPTMLRILDIIDAKGAYKDYLQEVNALISVGTAPLYQDLRDKIEKKYGIRIYQSYGLSETLFLTTEELSEEESSNSAGKLLPEVHFRLSEDAEVLVSVPWMFLGYVGKEEQANFLNGFYQTGDLGYVRDECLYINGRKKDLMIRGGFNINPGDIEGCLRRIDGLGEIVVLSCVRKDEEQVICCYTGNGKQDIHLLNGLLEKELGRHYRLDYLIRFDEIPKNLNGKADKQKIREILKKDDYKI